jgi:hypothetical protein
MCFHPSQTGKQELSRRQWLATTGALAATTVLARDSFAAVDSMDLAPRHHACVDQPFVPSNGDLATQLRSPVEQVMAEQAGLSQPVRSQAPQSALAQFGPMRAPARAAYKSQWNLDNKTLKIGFMNGASSLRDGVITIARQWCQYADLKFEPVRTSDRPDILIRFHRGFGHWSHVGRESLNESRNGRPSMTFAFLEGTDDDLRDRYSIFLVLHEFGHALGQIHEHTQPASELPFRRTADVYRDLRNSLGAGATNEDVEFNVFRRANRAELIKFSKYDRKSIMHYYFPARMFTDGQERPQNFELSNLDKAFAAIMYPGRDDVDVKKLLSDEDVDEAGTSTEETVSGEPTTLTIDGSTANGYLLPRQVAKYRFTVTAEHSSNRINIASQGGTQVVLQLYAAGNLKDEITPSGLDADGKPLHGTPDYTNDVIKATLAAGTYEVHVQHASRRGGGGFGISAKTGNQLYPRLAKPNVLQK